MSEFEQYVVVGTYTEMFHHNVNKTKPNIAKKFVNNMRACWMEYVALFVVQPVWNKK